MQWLLLPGGHSGRLGGLFPLFPWHPYSLMPFCHEWQPFSCSLTASLCISIGFLCLVSGAELHPFHFFGGQTLVSCSSSCSEASDGYFSWCLALCCLSALVDWDMVAIFSSCVVAPPDTSSLFCLSARLFPGILTTVCAPHGIKVPRFVARIRDSLVDKTDAHCMVRHEVSIISYVYMRSLLSKFF